MVLFSGELLLIDRLHMFPPCLTYEISFELFLFLRVLFYIHFALNFCRCCISRWVCGWYQITGTAAAVASVPGLRYMDQLVW